MEDFKNIAKILGIMFAFAAWPFYWFRLYETDDDVKMRIIKEETPKEYNFRIVSCKDYRGFNFVGIDTHEDTISCTIDNYWELRNKDMSYKYEVGDRIVKKKGAHVMYLIKPNGDSLAIHLWGPGDEWL